MRGQKHEATSEEHDSKKKEQAVKQSKRSNTKRSTVMLESPKENSGNAKGSTRLGEITEHNNLPQWDWEERWKITKGNETDKWTNQKLQNRKENILK